MILKFGSSDWTRTSDIRINSPPFYRLNYRGIVGTGRIISSTLSDVKGCFHLFCRLLHKTAKRRPAALAAAFTPPPMARITGMAAR